LLIRSEFLVKLQYYFFSASLAVNKIVKISFIKKRNTGKGIILVKKSSDNLDQKKRIVIVGPAYPLRGGNALFIAHLYELLSCRYDVKVVSFSKLYPDFLFPGVRQNDISSKGMKVHPAEHIINSVIPTTWQKAAKRIKLLKPDALILNWWQPFFGFLYNYLGRSYKRAFPDGKLVVIAENIISHESRLPDRFLTNMALKRAEYFITLSNSVHEEILRLYPGKPARKAALPIYDCYAPQKTLTIDEAKSALGLANKKVLLFFGYVRKYKGLDNLLKAMPIALFSCPDLHLLVVGEFYDSPAEYLDLIKQLGISNNVTIVNEYVPNEDVGKYYSAADLVVLPYNSATQSGILNIAFGFNKPVLVTRVGGLTESIIEGKNGIIVPPLNPKALAESIIEFFLTAAGDELRQNMNRSKASSEFELIIPAIEEFLK